MQQTGVGLARSAIQDMRTTGQDTGTYSAMLSSFLAMAKKTANVSGQGYFPMQLLTQQGLHDYHYLNGKYSENQGITGKKKLSGNKEVLSLDNYVKEYGVRYNQKSKQGEKSGYVIPLDKNTAAVLSGLSGGKGYVGIEKLAEEVTSSELYDGSDISGSVRETVLEMVKNGYVVSGKLEEELSDYKPRKNKDLAKVKEKDLGLLLAGAKSITDVTNLVFNQKNSYLKNQYDAYLLTYELDGRQSTMDNGSFKNDVVAEEKFRAGVPIEVPDEKVILAESEFQYGSLAGGPAGLVVLVPKGNSRGRDGNFRAVDLVGRSNLSEQTRGLEFNSKAFYDQNNRKELSKPKLNALAMQYSSEKKSS